MLLESGLDSSFVFLSYVLQSLTTCNMSTVLAMRDTVVAVSALILQSALRCCVSNLYLSTYTCQTDVCWVLILISQVSPLDGL